VPVVVRSQVDSTGRGRITAYIERILAGAKPCQPPIEQPNKFVGGEPQDAKALGIAIPQSVMVRADG
jgi:hypothetical protein